MKKDEKAVIIDQLQDLFARSTVGILTNYRGMKTADLIELRKRLKPVNGKFEIAKNTLAKFAAEKAGVKQLDSALTETTAIAFGFGEVRDLAAVMSDFVKSTKTVLQIKGGFLGGKLITAKDVVTLSTIPSKPVLIARFMGGLQMPLSMLVGQLNAPISGLANVLRARQKQLEGGAN